MLVGKKADDTALWCPKCEGIELLSKKDLLRNSGTSLSESSIRKNKLFELYTKKSIIGSLCASLETASMLGNNFRHICATSYAIKDILSESSSTFGNEEINWEHLQELLAIYEFEFQQLFINHSLIEDKYVVGIIIPENKISEYAMNEYDLSEQRDITVCRYTEDWNYNRLIAIRNGLYSDKDRSLEESGPKQWSTKPFWNSDLNRIKYGFQFAAGTSKLSKGLISNVNYIDEIEQLYNDFLYFFVPEIMDINGSSGQLWSTTKNQVLASLSNINSKQEEIYDKLIDIEFPLVVEVENLCFVLPNTCQYYLKLLYAKKHENDLNLEKNKWGEHFEKLVFNCLNLFGYEMNNPNNNKPLLNFTVTDEEDKIKGKSRSFELDVAGYNEKRSVIIECKHWDIGYNFFKRRSIEERQRQLGEQLEKFHHKLELINKKDSYSFLTENKVIDAYMVTLHPEPIKEYKGIKVVPFTQFNPEIFCNYSINEPVEKIKFRKPYILTKRKYQNGKSVLGIDYTKTIVNPYGLHTFCIEPESELKSYIFIGDGIVEQLDQDELTIIPPNKMQVTIDLSGNDISYLKSKKIKKGRKVRYQIYTKDPLFGTYYLRFIRRVR